MSGMLDISTRISSLLRAPLQTRVSEISQLVDQIPFKDLQTIFPQIVGSIFGNGGVSEDWGLTSITMQSNPHGFNHLHNFLIPNGPLFKICYRLIGDPQLKYVFPTRLLPLDVFRMLESGRVPQFYLDILNVDPQTRQIISLNLNPFDYYIFYFAVYLHNGPNNKVAWDTWNTVYYSLCCEYLFHFLPNDPNTPVTPYICYYTGKTAGISPIQTANRHSHFPSLLISQESMGSPSVTASATTQLHPRGEVWRSETVLQVFIDVWLSIATQHEQQVSSSSTVHPTMSTYPASDQVRVARSLIKQCHAFSLSASCDPTSLAELRRATPSLLSARALRHIRHLMHSWPLDTSFRLVLELWFSYIQPWRYANLKDERNRQSERLDSSTEEPARPTVIDRSFKTFISDNLLAYSEIFQLVVPRFLRLDLAAPKNAIMLFRLAKVFSQSNLIHLLIEVEKSVTSEMELNGVNGPTYMNQYPSTPQHSYLHSNNSGVFDRTAQSLDGSFNVCNQLASPAFKPALGSLSGFMDIASSQYQPLFLGAGRPMVRDLIVYAQQAQIQIAEIINLREEHMKAQRKGFFGGMWYWLMGDCESSDEVPLDELKKVSGYLNFAICQLAESFAMDVPSQDIHNIVSPQSSPTCETGSTVIRRNVSKYNIALSPKEAQVRARHIRYMGNPDLQPVKSYESGFLVHLLNQLASRVNEMYSEEMKTLWLRQDLVGAISRQALESPCEIRSFSKSGSNYGALIPQNLPPRLCLRPLASHKFIFWFSFFCSISYLMGYGIPLFITFSIVTWGFIICLRGIYKYLLGSDNPANIREQATYQGDSFNNTDDSERYSYMYREQSG